MAALDGLTPAIIGAANSASADFAIERSLRFNDGDTPELTRTPSSTGNTNTFTLSFWAKRCLLGSTQMIVQTGDDYSNLFRAYWDGNDNFRFHQYNGSYVMDYTTSAEYRDVGAWYHYVIAIDTTQAVAADRVKVYVNGAEITDFSATTDPSLNLTTGWNAAITQRIGREYTTTYGNYYNYGGYLAEFYNIDGQQLAASDFGEYDSDNVWQPKQYQGGFDDWFDTSQTWSGLWSGSVGYGSFANLHDTNLTNYMQSLDATLTLSSPIAVTSLRILLQRYGASGTSLSINGTDESSQLPSAPSGIVWVDITGVTSLTSINVTSGDYSSNTLGLYAIEVNGKLLLDTGTSASNNGFHLDFSDNSSTSALGTDSSGNSNNYTVTNLSVTPGVDNDSLLDSPTDGDTTGDTGVGGQISGNYCVINPLGRSANNPTVSDGNLKMVLGAAQGTRHGTMGVTSGKWYFEVVYTAATAFDGMVGVANKNHENNLGNYIGGDSDSWGYYYDGQKYHPGQSGAYGASWTTNDVMGIALDMDNGALYFSKNGTYQNGGDPTSGASKTGAAFTNLSGTIFPGLNAYGGTQFVNFGQRPFNTSAPSGYKTWNTANLPTPAIADGATALNATLWTGTGSSKSITGYGFAPDFVWIKCRNNTASNALLDIVRGSSQVLRTDGTAAQTNNTTVWTSFDSDGFTLGADTSNGWTNYNTWTYVGWAWKAGSSTVTVAKDANGTNLPGAECQVRANTTNGTSIVVVANPQANEARVHGLNAAPDFFICKSTASADSWHCYWSILGYTKYINLNGTGPAVTSDQFGSQDPDSTYFYVKPVTGSGANKSGGMVYYLFTTVEGYSSFGKYTGNGNSDGPFISTGFRPKWVLIKSSSDTGNWGLWDTERDTFNVSTKRLQPQSGAAESGNDPNVYIDILSNGFKIRNSDTDSNGSSREYIYAAFAEHPFKTTRAR